MKRICLVLLSFAIMLLSCSAVFADTEVDCDVNGDGEVNMFDCILVKSIYFGAYNASDDEFLRADVNQNGKVDALDYIAVKKEAFSENDSAKDIEFTASEFNGRMEAYDAAAGDSLKSGYMPSFMVGDTEELDEFVSLYSYYATTPSPFLEYASTLDDEYFENKTLLIAYGKALSGGDEFKVEKVSMDESGILMDVTLSEIGVTEDIKYTLLIAEVDKSDIGECTEFRAMLRIYDIYGLC